MCYDRVLLKSSVVQHPETASLEFRSAVNRRVRRLCRREERSPVIRARRMLHERRSFFSIRAAF